MSLKRKLDYEDYARLPDDGKRYEILDGELYVTAAPSPFHQRLSKRLQRRLDRVLAARGRGVSSRRASDGARRAPAPRLAGSGH